MNSVLFKMLKHAKNISIVGAHCDIPCKIYDPMIAQVASLSVVRLLDIMEEISGQTPPSLLDQNTLSRCIIRKEEEAEKVKKEIRVLWGDYFKTPHFDIFPEIHDLSHGIMQKASACKQGIQRKDGEELVNLVNRFAEIFWETKGVKTITRECPYPPHLKTVYLEH
mgnify:CR=1 FL=1